MKVKFVTSGYRDLPGFIEELEKALKDYDLFVYPDPELKDQPSDTGIIISDVRLAKHDVKWLSNKRWNQE